MIYSANRTFVPHSGEYLNDLRVLQRKVYAEIIRGDKPLDYFDEFVKQWKAQGGDLLTREANKLQQEKLAIYQQVGVPKRLQR